MYSQVEMLLISPPHTDSPTPSQYDHYRTQPIQEAGGWCSSVPSALDVCLSGIVLLPCMTKKL